MQLNGLDQKQRVTLRRLHLPGRVLALGRISLVMILGLGLGLLLAEIALRLLTPFFPYQLEPYLSQKAWLLTQTGGLPQFVAEHRLLWEQDDYLRERVKPDVDLVIHGNPEYPAWPVKTDSLGLGPVGFRDTLPPGQTPYALVLGDSFGFGMGVKQAEIWSELLEQQSGLPFVNLAQTGASSIQEARVYARYGHKLPARLVFWLFFQNDLKDNLRFAHWVNPNAAIIEAARQPDQLCTGPVHTFLERYSLAYELVLYAQRACHYSKLTANPSYRDLQLSLTFCLDHDICDLAVQKRMLSDGWPLTRQALLDTLAQLNQKDTTLVIVTVPSKEQVYWNQFQQVAAFPPDYDIDQLVAPLHQFCLSEKLHCLDLTATFRVEAQKGKQLYFPVDIHWNAAGHALAAQAIEDYLRQEKLLP